MIILSGYVLKLNELNGPFKPSENELTLKFKKFPYLSYDELINGIDLSNKNFLVNIENISYKKKIISNMSKIAFPFSKKKEIAMLPNSPLSRSDILYLIKNNISIDFLNNASINIDEIELQFKELKYCIQNIFEKLNILKSPDLLVELIKKHISERITNKLISVKKGLIIGGSMTELLNTFFSSISKNNKSEFISIVHGEGDQLLFDEPLYGYGDRSLPSILFGFGVGGKFLKGRNHFWKSLYKQPKYITSNSDFIKSIFVHKDIKKAKNINKMTWMYVPDSYLYTKRTGPYGGNIPSRLYEIWQKKLIKSFNKIIYKKHPKGHFLYRNLSKKNIHDRLSIDNKHISIVYDNFYKIYKNCDGYIFDHISTAMMIAISSDKPIIYFNIGKRNLSDYVVKLMKKRCIWIDVDPLKADNIRDRIESFSTKIYTNNITQEFSLDTDNSNLLRKEKLLLTIKSLI